jgi:hypothetical protein
MAALFRVSMFLRISFCMAVILQIPFTGSALIVHCNIVAVQYRVAGLGCQGI